VPVFGNAIAAEELLNPMAVQFKKSLADAAMNAATKAGATYCDVRIGRYLNQFITTRDLNVENIVNTESSGVGVRVIANGAYGFCATNVMTLDAVADAARQAVAIAKANSKLQTEPVVLAPVKGVGEVAWATPFKRTGAPCRSRKRPRCCWPPTRPAWKPAPTSCAPCCSR
jgi:TldD protein